MKWWNISHLVTYYSWNSLLLTAYGSIFSLITNNMTFGVLCSSITWFMDPGVTVALHCYEMPFFSGLWNILFSFGRNTNCKYFKTNCYRKYLDFKLIKFQIKTYFSQFCCSEDNFFKTVSYVFAPLFAVLSSQAYIWKR